MTILLKLYRLRKNWQVNYRPGNIRPVNKAYISLLAAYSQQYLTIILISNSAVSKRFILLHKTAE